MMASTSSESSAARHSPAPSVSSVASTPSISAPPPSAAAPEKFQDDSSKLKAVLGILRKFIGVSDIAAVRFSLPAQLMEPIPNLEYWHYLDRPETFVSIGKSESELGRMLEVLRFWFTKDLKYVKGKPCKPYNSTLGEFFRCNWEIKDEAPSITVPSPGPDHIAVDPTKSRTGTSPPTAEPVRISYLTEQTSHHPPLSAYYVYCPQRGIVARGYDQISAKFTGTSLRVTPGNYNQGIFITLTKRDNEEYQLTHPAASLGGLLRGSLSISVADICYITCCKTRIKTILHYQDENWLGSAKHLVQGVVFKYDPDTDKITRIKDVPEKDVLARIEGCWKEQLYYSIPNTRAVKEGSGTTNATNQKQLLIDLIPLMPVPKMVPNTEDQLPNESRRFWKDVTDAIVNKRWGEATKYKQDLEERQREKLAVRKQKNLEWKPRFFTEVATANGRPELTEEGKKALQGMQELRFALPESEVYGA